jgi:hypothetical protein
MSTSVESAVYWDPYNCQISVTPRLDGLVVRLPKAQI